MHRRLFPFLALSVLLLSQTVHADCRHAGAQHETARQDTAAEPCAMHASGSVAETDDVSPDTGDCCGDGGCGCLHTPALATHSAFSPAVTLSPTSDPASAPHKAARPFRLLRPPA